MDKVTVVPDSAHIWGMHNESTLCGFTNSCSHIWHRQRLHRQNVLCVMNARHQLVCMLAPPPHNGDVAMQLANAVACMQRLMACIKEFQRLLYTWEDVEPGFWQVLSPLDVLP
jgi:hypothetical protein